METRRSLGVVHVKLEPWERIPLFLPSIAEDQPYGYCIIDVPSAGVFLLVGNDQNVWDVQRRTFISYQDKPRFLPFSGTKGIEFEANGIVNLGLVDRYPFVANEGKLPFLQLSDSGDSEYMSHFVRTSMLPSASSLYSWLLCHTIALVSLP